MIYTICGGGIHRHRCQRDGFPGTHPATAFRRGKRDAGASGRGRKMSESRAISSPSGRPFAARVRHVTTDEPIRWLAAGWSDFRAAAGASFAYGFVFVAAGVVLAAALLAANMMYLFLPFATGFMIVGPALTIGFYAISRDLERAQTPSFARAVLAFQANPG